MAISHQVVLPSLKEEIEVSRRTLRELERKEALFNAEVARREAEMDATQKPQRDVEKELHEQQVLVNWLEGQLEIAWMREKELKEELCSAQ